MGHQKMLYLFGDQTFDVEPHMPKLLDAGNTSVVLRNFLDSVYDVLRLHIFQLPVNVRGELPRFTGIEDVMLWKQPKERSRCVPLDMAMTCLYQLGSFIISQTGKEYPKSGETCILGLCTGALAAVTIGGSRSLDELVPRAVEAVAIAFSVGSCVYDMKTRLLVSEEMSRPWSIMVAGPLASPAVCKFCEESTLPVTARPFISVYTPSGLAVSGPPSSLDELTSSLHFQGLKHKAKAVYAPYHAPHLYSAADIEDLIAPFETANWLHTLTPIPIMSSNGKWVEGSSFKDLLTVALESILLEPIDWNGILDGVRTSIGQLGEVPDWKVESFGSRADQLIYMALKQPAALGRSLTPRPSAERLSSDPGNVSKRAS
ncbi:hypothetical protein ANO14919_079720 [Xylariales sp. No.14919]|nr:hypothetical protein ANO14919_079720 [Xylariales sp. No.14919]